MTKFLLDTHALLWWLTDDAQLRSDARAVISSNENLIAYSAASIWEIRIKEGLGKISLPPKFAEILQGESMEEIPVRAVHAHELIRLPLLHRDPFDRIFVAQARIEGATLITRDRTLERYGISVLEA
jgi:PIN domain nuclease of toxin-antitoxin system